MKILGIDPGLSTTGYGIVEVRDDKLKFITHGSIRKLPRAGFAENLLGIFQGIPIQTEISESQTKWQTNLFPGQGTIFYISND